jgi:DegV family protein with EDD domain
VDTLEYLKRGGRIGGAAAFMGSLLDMKPILTLRAGRVEALERARTKTRALARIKELVLESCPRSSDAWLCVLQSAALTDAEKLSGDFASAFGFATVPIYELGPAIVTHAGPGTIGVGFFAGG